MSASSKALAFSELLLLVGLLAVAYLLYVQQEQLAELTVEIDRVRGAVGELAKVPEEKQQKKQDGGRGGGGA